MSEELALEHTPDGYRLVVSRPIDATPESVWDLFVDTSRWPDWGPTVSDVECPNQRIETGATGRVKTVAGVWVPFVVTACADFRWTWRIGPLPATGHRVDSDGQQCRAAFEVPLYAVPYVPVCRRALRTIDAIAAGDRTPS
ncbi:MAG: SRPBCC family protein [Halobacteriales archaeon]